MKSVLAALFREINNVAIDGTIEPEAIVSKSDTVVGKCSDEAKKVYILRTKIINRSREVFSKKLLLVAEALTQNLFPPPPPDFIKLLNESSVLCTKEKPLGELFWYLLREEFPQLCNKPSIGIRKGWEVVWTNPMQEQEIEEKTLNSIFEALKKHCIEKSEGNEKLN